MAGIRGERCLRQVELFGRHRTEKSVDPASANLDVIVEKQDRLVTQEQIRPELHGVVPNGGCLGSSQNNRNVSLQVDAALVVIVEENVIAARLFKVGCVKSWGALDEDKDVAFGLANFAFDAQPPIGVEAVLAGPQLLPIERRPDLAVDERAVEDPERCLLERAGLNAARDVATEFDIDVGPRTPSSRVIRARESAGSGWGGSGPNPDLCDTYQPWSTRRTGRAVFGSGRARYRLEQASAHVSRDVRVAAEGVGIEEGVGTIAEPLANQGVMSGSERPRGR